MGLPYRSRGCTLRLCPPMRSSSWRRRARPLPLEVRVDPTRFDALARFLAARPSRRQLLRALGGSLVAGLAGGGRVGAANCPSGVVCSATCCPNASDICLAGQCTSCPSGVICSAQCCPNASDTCVSGQCTSCASGVVCSGQCCAAGQTCRAGRCAGGLGGGAGTCTYDTDCPGTACCG